MASTQATAESLVSGVKGGVESVSNLAQKATAVASGKEKEKQEERERRQAEAAREKKRKNALVTFRGEPYTWVSLVTVWTRLVGSFSVVRRPCVLSLFLGLVLAYTF